ncbi:hypothetical protein ACFL2T_01790 [Elusimicrobiota bacterium]
MAKRNLRDHIRSHEAKTGQEVLCMGICRCLHCPMSAVGCFMAKQKLSNS